MNMSIKKLADETATLAGTGHYMMIALLELVTEYRCQFEDKEWYGRKAGSIKGGRSREIQDLVMSSGGQEIPRTTISKIAKVVEMNTMHHQGQSHVNRKASDELMSRVRSKQLKVEDLVDGNW